MKTLTIVTFIFTIIYAQDDLLTLIDDQETTPVKVQGTFKATRIVNAQSIELPRKKTLEFIMFHRFGSMTNGFYDLYGLDNAAIRFDLNYGHNEYFSFGFGRSSLNKTYDIYTKTTEPVLNFLSKNSNFQEIDGTLEIDEITAKIDTFINV